MLRRSGPSEVSREADTVFLRLGSPERIARIERAAEFVCYAAPGIEEAEATSLAKAAARLGPDRVSISLDFSESVMRMGYGDLSSVELLRRAGIDVRSTPGLRLGLFVVDRRGFFFTPLARYLEAEAVDCSAPNALRLSPQRALEAMARLSPTSQEIALSATTEPSERRHLDNHQVEVSSDAIEDRQIAEVAGGLSKAPPVPFDLARQVRVYTAYLQYIELKLSGASIQRRRIVLPKALVGLGADPEIDERLRTTFDLIKKASDLSSKGLEQELNRIRDTFTQRLDALHGRVFLRADKPALEARLDAFRKLLDEHRERVMKDLHAHLAESRTAIIEYFAPKVVADPPPSMFPSYGGNEVSLDTARSWIQHQLTGVFPSPAELVQKMKLDILYRDVTFENLKSKDFRLLVKAAFPTQDWDRLHDEFVAVGPGSSPRSDD